MVATSRWVKFDANADTFISAVSSNTTSGTGTNGYMQGQGVVSGIATITAGVADQMEVAVNLGSYNQITLSSGTSLDCRTIARDITFQLKQIADPLYDNLVVEYVNNKFRIRSSTLGGASQINVDNGSNDCLHLLGMAASQGGSLTIDEVPGAVGSNNVAYTGQVSAAGVYAGQFDDIYTVIIGTEHPVSGCIASGTNIYGSAGVSVAGDWNQSSDETYTITVSTTNGSLMNNGTGNVPTITWTSTAGDINANPVELLFSDYWCEIGTKGLRIKFEDSLFGNGDTFYASCVAVQEAAPSATAAAVTVAEYVWSSLREGKSTSSTATSEVGTAVGSKGVTIAFSNSGSLTRRDTFRIICSGPQPTTLGVSVLNFGSVTVTTYSPVNVVWFELISGATMLSSAKFGLNSHGTAQHHNQGNNDTKFGFGASGEASPGSNGTQWHKGVTGIDLSSDTPPAYLNQTEDNMPVVNTADNSIPIGVAPGEMVTDFIYLAIKLGALEVGSNAGIVWRQFFDFS